MIPYSNLHTHTSYSDGANTPEEMICAALEAGCVALGFSDHSFTPFDPDYCMAREREEEYQSEIRRLAAKYQSQIAVFCGIEQDLYSSSPREGYDFIIGSVHYVLKNEEYIPIDNTPEILINAVNKHYNGDFYALAEDYYAAVSQIIDKTHCNIIGHFDLITKFNEGNTLFDETNPRYLAAAKKAIHKCASGKTLFEINTGAISRGYRKTPYPSFPLLREILKADANVLFSSDCHSAKTILTGFDFAVKQAQLAGFQQMYALTSDGLMPFSIAAK